MSKAKDSTPWPHWFASIIRAVVEAIPFSGSARELYRGFLRTRVAKSVFPARAFLDDAFGLERSELSKFEAFVSSLPCVPQEVDNALKSARTDFHFLRSKLAKPTDREHFDHRVEQILEILAHENLSEAQIAKIRASLETGRIAPAMSADELRHVRAWIPAGSVETLAVASQLYYHRFVGRSVTRRILKSTIVHQTKAWIARGEIPEEEAPDPDWLVQRLIEQKLIRPFKKSEYVNKPDEEFQEFHEGSWLRSVGKAAYLFEISDPDRPHEQYPIGRFPGSTPGKLCRERGQPLT